VCIKHAKRENEVKKRENEIEEYWIQMKRK
jgi:hypothetical protein